MKSDNLQDLQEAINKLSFSIAMSPDVRHKTHSEVVKLVECCLPGMAFLHIPNWSGLSTAKQKQITLAVVDRLEKSVGILSPLPTIIEKNAKPQYWLNRVKEDPNVEHTHFENYKTYLAKSGYATTVVDTIEKTCEQILARCANPKEVIAEEKKKKGLVVGDVQSGKTSNYMGLINMALDYGYKIIVLLAGTTNSLRLQTQKRVDKGAIGAKSDSIGKTIEFLGVGKDNKEYYVIPFTDQENDFAKCTHNRIHWNFDDCNKPVILVVKKEKSILKSVSERLQSNIDLLQKKSATAPSDTKSLLIIDDEADNASVNTSSNKDKPSTINGYIREIFNKFPVVSYVGYTATPFANVLIPPDADEDDENRDLFPEDFIVQLETPTNYFGGRIVFPHDIEKLPKHLKRLEPSEDHFLPVKHERTTKYSAMADSLKEAVLMFLINNVIRSIRNQTTEHRSMMINISRFNDVQTQVYERTKEYLHKLERIIEQTYKYETSLFTQNDEMKKIYDLFVTNSYYERIRKGDESFSPVEWHQIQDGLYTEIKQVQIVVINSRNGDVNKIGADGKPKRFDYEQYEREGARVIAIGGMVLSRGLTLEGLMISYYSRNAGTYDSLLQMCRWFGYRPGYEDLCRIYLSQENISRFNSALEAVEDLKIQFEDMKRKDKKPQNYGLMIKTNPYVLETQLLVTARNKCKGAESRPFYLSYGGVYGDTSKMYCNPEKNKSNKIVLDTFFEHVKFTDEGIALDVPKIHIANLVKELNIPYLNKKFDVDGLSKYIEEHDKFNYWDVVVEKGSSKESAFRGNPAVVRSFCMDSKKDKFIRLGGNNNRVMEPSVFQKVLNEEEVRLAEIRLLQKKNDPDPKKRSKQLSIKDYLFHVRKKPIFIIYPIELHEGSTGEAALWERNVIKSFGSRSANGENLLFAFGFGFPNIESGKKFVYLLNKVKQDEIQGEIEIEDDEEGADNGSEQ